MRIGLSSVDAGDGSWLRLRAPSGRAAPSTQATNAAPQDLAHVANPSNRTLAHHGVLFRSRAEPLRLGLSSRLRTPAGDVQDASVEIRMHADQAKPEATDFFAAGDYSFWSRILEPASQSLVEAARVGAGGRVLDVAAGDGNTALAASRRGAIVTALDPLRRRSSGGGSGPGWRTVRSVGPCGR